MELPEDFDDDLYSGANAGEALCRIFSEGQPVDSATEAWLRWLGTENAAVRSQVLAELPRKLLTIEDMLDDDVKSQVLPCVLYLSVSLVSYLHLFAS